MHKGIKSILTGFTVSAIGIIIILVLIFFNDSQIMQSNQYFVFLFGAFALIAVLIGPSIIILNYIHILQWIGMKFGKNVLIVIVFVSALIMTGSLAIVVVGSIIKKEIHTHVIISMISVTAALWIAFYKLFVDKKKINHIDPA